MHLRLIGAVLVLLGLVAAATGIASATLWRPADTVQAEALAPGASTLLVTDPGVLELLADTVTARASGAQGAGVTMAVGREADVLAWVGVDPHVRVTGLADAATLVTVPGQPVDPPVEVPARDDDDADDDAPAGADPGKDTDSGKDTAADDAEGTVAPDPAGSDMWVAEVTGRSSAELVWEARPGRWALLVASTGDEAGPPTLELTWPREVVTPWLRPGLWIGGTLVLVGAAVLVLGWLRGRPGEDEWTEIEETEVAAPSGPLTRRQLRELEAARAAGRGWVRRRRPGRGDASDDAGLAAASASGGPGSTASAAGQHEGPAAAVAVEHTTAPAGDGAAGPDGQGAPATSDDERTAQPGAPVPPAPGPAPRRAGVVAHVPAAPAVPPSSWTPTGADVREAWSATSSDTGVAVPTGPPAPAATPPQAGDAAPYVPRFVPVPPGGAAPPGPRPGSEEAPTAPAHRAGRDAVGAPAPATWPEARPPAAVPPVTWPSIATGHGPAAPDGPRHESPGAVAHGVANEPAPDPAHEPAQETAARRSRTGKFFSRRTRREAPEPVGHAAPALGPAPDPTATAHGPAGPAAAEPSVPGSGHEPHATGPTSADAWRARWGFVEVPPTQPPGTAEGDDGQEGDRP